MYGETNLGATEDAVILFLKSPVNKRLFDALKRHVYPEFALQFDAEQAASEPVVQESNEPESDPTTGKGRSRK